MCIQMAGFDERAECMMLVNNQDRLLFGPRKRGYESRSRMHLQGERRQVASTVVNQSSMLRKQAEQTSTFCCRKGRKRTHVFLVLAEKQSSRRYETHTTHYDKDLASSYSTHNGLQGGDFLGQSSAYELGSELDIASI